MTRRARVGPTLLALAALAATADHVRGQCLGPRRAPSTRATLVVSADWLARHAGDAGVVILHAGLDRRAYERAHIPGARFLDSRVLPSFDWAGVGLLAPEALADSLGALGLANDSRVVLYGSPLPVARAFLALDVLGHGDQVSVLDGGLDAWREGTASKTGAASSGAPGNLEPRLETWRLVDADWVREAVERRDVVIIDARSQAEFEAGHIAGARNLDWRLTLHGGVDVDIDGSPRLRSVAELRRLFRRLGIDAAEEVVFYSDDGSRAAHLYFIARYLGYEPRIHAAPPGAWRRDDS